MNQAADSMHANARPARPARISASLVVACALALVAIVSWFSVLDLRKLQHPDEGRYAEIAREMAQSGDYVTPRLNGLKYFEKPPLQYWLTAAAFNAFEVDAWSARLVPAIAGLLSIAIVGVVTRRLTGDARAGIYAALTLGSTVMHIVMSHYATLDALLSFCLVGALGCFLLAQRDGLSRGRVRMLMMGAFAFAGFATLTKGLVAPLLCAASLGIYTLVTRDGGPWRRLHAVPGLLVFVAITAPWFVRVAADNPEFAQFFFVHEHLQRFLTTTHRREGAWWYFLPLLVVGFMPWSGLLAMRAYHAWRDAPRNANGFSWARFCGVWVLFVLAFFSVSSSKLPSYILPMFPPLAMLLGWQMAILPARAFRWTVPILWATTAMLVGVLVIVLFAYEPLVARFSSDRQPVELFQAFRPWVLAALAIWIAGSVVAALALARPSGMNRDVGIVVLAIATLAGMQVAFVGHDAFRPTRSSWDILRDAENAPAGRLDPSAPVYQVRMFDQTFPFYLGRTTTLVEFVDEFALGIAAEPWKVIPSEAAWLPVWTAMPQAYALMQKDDYERLAATSLPMRVLARDPRRVLVARR